MQEPQNNNSDHPKDVSGDLLQYSPDRKAVVGVIGVTASMLTTVSVALITMLFDIPSLLS
jgi:hypothetical protein